MIWYNGIALCLLLIHKPSSSLFVKGLSIRPTTTTNSVGSTNFAKLTSTTHKTTLRKNTCLFLSSDSDSEAAEIAKMKAEIEEMRREAARRIEGLSQELSTASPEISTKTEEKAKEEVEVVSTTSSSTSPQSPDFQEKTAISNSISTNNEKKINNGVIKSIDELLDETSWKVNLDIGRERYVYVCVWSISEKVSEYYNTHI